MRYYALATDYDGTLATEGRVDRAALEAPERFAETLRARGVGPLSVGRVIVVTWTPHETTVLETIRELGLELQVIFNKGAVMVLPSGVNKATGRAAALEALGLSPRKRRRSKRENFPPKRAAPASGRRSPPFSGDGRSSISLSSVRFSATISGRTATWTFWSPLPPTPSGACLIMSRWKRNYQPSLAGKRI